MTMSFFNNLTIFSFIFITPTLIMIDAAIFNIQNNCSYTVWAAANPGGGRKLNPGQTWVINTDPKSNNSGRIWARTNCDFTVETSNKCESGDCSGVLYCESNGAPPLTLAEYAFYQNHNQSLDFFGISLLQGFNVPMEFSPTTNGCTTGVKCMADINRLCPTELRDLGGCHHPCIVFNNDQFCCRSRTANCGPNTPYFKFFTDACPNVYSYALDDVTKFTCPTGTDYKVVFCP